MTTNSAPIRSRKKSLPAVIGAKGEPMTSTNFEDMIPPPNFDGRWTASKKADAGQAIKAGFLTMEDALARWPGTTRDEIKNEWIDHYANFGLTGVKVTKIQTFGDHQRTE